MRMLIMGPPGAGKGTQAALISEHLGVPGISTGAIFRAHVKGQTDLGRQISAIIADGGFVPDELTDRIVFDRLQEPDAMHGWLLDGFPRTLKQVSSLDAFLESQHQAIDIVIVLVAEPELLVQRLLRRAEIEGRPDDTEAVIRHRLEMYAHETEPLIAVYRGRGLLLEVNGVGAVDDVHVGIHEALAEKFHTVG